MGVGQGKLGKNAADFAGEHSSHSAHILQAFGVEGFGSGTIPLVDELA